MKERPILFSGAMVRALQDGSKTQTRRLITRGNSYRDGVRASKARWAELNFESPLIFVDDGPSLAGNPGPYLHVPDHDLDAVHRIYPQWQPGDHLFVRENGWERPGMTASMIKDGADTWPRYEYDADGINSEEVESLKMWEWKRRPSIHMPRWASRITLEIESVRVERLQDISEADAIAEGIDRIDNNFGNGPAYCDYRMAQPDDTAEWFSSSIRSYQTLWEQINGPESWNANPWVWVVSFRRICDEVTK